MITTESHVTNFSSGRHSGDVLIAAEDLESVVGPPAGMGGTMAGTRSPPGKRWTPPGREMVMGIRMTLSFKGTDGIRRENCGNCIGAIISRGRETEGTAKIARARTIPKKIRRISFRHRVTG
jgi:hypothetical protein